MILVDVYVPELDSKYDFELDVETSTEILIGEMVSLIEQKEKLSLKTANSKNRYLYHLDRKCILKQKENLARQGVKSGDRLIIV